MRLIDADKLIADIEKYNLSDGKFQHWAEVQPTIETEPRWIPIEQDCPEKGKDVLISHNGVVSIDWLTQSEGVGYFFVSGVAIQDIDAWMPLPEPYKMDEVEREPTMEEYMYGQDLGSVEDGSL